jgi:hypothetical protein
MITAIKKILRPTFSAIHELSIATKIELEIVLVVILVLGGAW